MNATPEKDHCRREPVDTRWDDDEVIPDELTPDTAFLFARMTEETLAAVDAQPGEKVLDVGCGRGLDLISQRFGRAELYGIDASLVMLHKASVNFRSNVLPPRLVCASAEQLPFADSRFDRVYCKGALDHFYDPGKAGREMSRVLSPNGRLVVSVANFESLTCRLGRLISLFWRRKANRHQKERPFWEIPDDHVYEFNDPFLLSVLPSGFRLDLRIGISLLWGLPQWSKLLSVLPQGIVHLLLRSLDRAARVLPGWADVILVRAQGEPSSPEPAPP